MKLRKRIAAAFTALALMFTLTDPAALGGLIGSSSVASAFYGQVASCKYNVDWYSRARGRYQSVQHKVKLFIEYNRQAHSAT